MHKYNNPELVRANFYAKPNTSSNKRLEYIFNNIFKTLPNTLYFSEEFDLGCLSFVEENFELFCSDVGRAGTITVDEGVWVGKKDTPYEDVFLGTTYKTKEGESVAYDGVMTRFPHAGISSDNGAKYQELYISVRAVCPDKKQIYLLIEAFAPFKIKQTNKIHILAQEYGDLSFAPIPIPDSNVDLALNYGEDFIPFHNKLVASINEQRSGLYLFYGEPGTGKSSYIKHLLTGEIKRKIAYIPVGLIDKLTHPDMVPLLMNSKDIVLVLEDAEKALLSRDVSDNSAIVSTILNLTDGFIGQALNITLIATFNTEKDKIDAALLRKGRLKLSHEFKKLSVGNAQKIADKLGIPAREITEDMTLADIYNFEKATHYEEPKARRVGFFND
jgi:hypothetical protein